MNTGVLNTSDGNAVQTEQVFIGEFTRDMTAASGTQAITGVGFQPKFVTFIAGEDISSMWSVGMDNGTDEACIRNVGATTGVDYAASPSIYLLQSGSNLQRANIQSLDSDGFTLDWIKTASPSAATAEIIFTAYR
jgi:hypothetical protein